MCHICLSLHKYKLGQAGLGSTTPQTKHTWVKNLSFLELDKFQDPQTPNFHVWLGFSWLQYYTSSIHQLSELMDIDWMIMVRYVHTEETWCTQRSTLNLKYLKISAKLSPGCFFHFSKIPWKLSLLSLDL